MKKTYFALGIICAFVSLPCGLMGCAMPKALPQQTESLTEARQGFKTTLVPPPDAAPREAVEEAPTAVFRTVKYTAPSGEMAAYVSPDPGDGKKHAAILWITGGDCNSIDDVWSPAPRDNDQTGAIFRQSGLVMMFPSLRGGNQNPGVKEGFLGEVDDVLAAERYLAALPYVDPTHIYLGGHSTGGTLALLVAESTDTFRATFSYGPMANVAGYRGYPDIVPFDLSNKKEVELRSPGYWLSSIRTPTWVFEGTAQGNIIPLRLMAHASTNPNVHFLPIAGATHFSTLAPTNELIAKKILQDTGPTCNLSFTEDEVDQNFTR